MEWVAVDTLYFVSAILSPRSLKNYKDLTYLGGRLLEKISITRYQHDIKAGLSEL